MCVLLAALHTHSFHFPAAQIIPRNVPSTMFLDVFTYEFGRTL